MKIFLIIILLLFLLFILTGMLIFITALGVSISINEVSDYEIKM